MLESNWGAHVRGTIIERELWLPAMTAKFGRDFKMAGRFQQTLSRGYLSATPDGVVVNRGHEVLSVVGVEFDKRRTSRAVAVECKSIDPRVNLTEEKTEHAFQVQVQMGLLRELTPYKPDWAVISYVDASFWHEVAEYAVPFRPEDFEAADLRAAKIINADPSDQRPEGWIAGGRECGYCPWRALCAEMRGHPVADEEASAVDDQLRAEIIDLCKQANRIQTELAEDTKALRDVQDLIKTRLSERKVRKIEGVVNWYHVRGRESWDVEAMVEELTRRKVDVEQFRTAGEPTSALSVSKKVALL